MTSLSMIAVDATTRLTKVWPWYITRASGIIAALLLSLLMISGISAFTGHQFKFMAPLKSWANHRTIGIAFAVAVTVHISSLLFDKYITFSPAEVLLPLESSYKQITIIGSWKGSAGVALGIISLYLGGLIILTSLTKIMTALPSLWKLTHYFSYVIVGLIFLHSIMIGTDLKTGIWRYGWIALNLIVLWFIAIRLRRAGSLRR